MGCVNHAISNANCLACQVKSISTEQRGATREARRANDLQAQANAQAAQQAAYQAESAAVAAEEAFLARLAAERQASNTSNYERSMWLQSDDGKTWNAWALRANAWISRAAGHDEFLLPYWKEAAAPGWNDPAKEAERREYLNKTQRVMIGILISLIGVLIGLVVQRFTDSTVVWVFTEICKWSVPVLVIVLLVLVGRGGGRAQPLVERAEQSETAREFARTYGASPFHDPEHLPSWRPGLTVAQAAASATHLAGFVHLAPGFYPRPGQLPAIPELRLRDLSEFPPVVADAVRARFNLPEGDE